jgi:hypothetical protein
MSRVTSGEEQEKKKSKKTPHTPLCKEETDFRKV